MKLIFKSALAALCLTVCQLATAQDAAAPVAAPVTVPAGMGTLVVDVNQFTSEKELPKKVNKQLANGGLEWGIKDNQIVFTMVGKQFLDFPINHMTRYGQNESLQLPAGEYRITGIGLEAVVGFSVQKILDKGAYVNENVMTFTIEPGKTTTLNIKPVIYKDNAIVTWYMPTLVGTTRSEAGTSTEVQINTRTDASIAWPQYNGPLKFVAK
ncbi:hypothetical protein ACFPN1_10850 [Lysobacter yangpyeongensis]|uniref:Uncharacterized protein n=1 Tax=Lysobacter yangpyeongensis TaxID=346182 RepID=A0ABW0SNA5_9GAMM